MHLEEFAWGKSFFHRIDPRIKFAAFFPYLFFLALLPGLSQAAAALVISTAFVIRAGLDTRKVINRLLIANGFIVLIWVFLPFSQPGEILFTLGPAAASREGILLALTITLKTNAIILATIAILGTSEVFALTHALVHLRCPEKLIHLFFFFYRYLSVLHEEYTKLTGAMRIRCFRPATTLNTYRSYAYLIGMLLIRSHDRAERIYQAMVCRGFKNRFHLAHHFHLHREDGVFALLMLAATGVILLFGLTETL